MKQLQPCHLDLFDFSFVLLWFIFFLNRKMFASCQNSIAVHFHLEKALSRVCFSLGYISASVQWRPRKHFPGFHICLSRTGCREGEGEGWGCLFKRRKGLCETLVSVGSSILWEIVSSRISYLGTGRLALRPTSVAFKRSAFLGIDFDTERPIHIIYLLRFPASTFKRAFVPEAHCLSCDRCVNVAAGV